MTRSYRPSITRILAELGETNIRCALLDDGNLHDIRMYKLADYNSMAHVLDSYCKDVQFERQSQMGLLLALAPQLQADGTYHFKFRPNWNFRPRDLINDLGLASIHILNDLESHAYAVMGGLRGDTLFSGKPREKEGPVAVIAPGTGLGFAYVYPELNHVQQAFGAHMNFLGLGANDTHFKVLEGRMLFGTTSYEDIVSGPGLQMLKDKIGNDEAYTYFARVFGLFIQQAVFFSHAVGGVVITGGLIPALLKEHNLDWDVVRKAYFVDTIPAATTMLENTPWTIIDDPHLGLKGLLTWAKMNIDTSRGVL